MITNKLHIGYISYELPPDISQGGIGTYTLQAAILMKSRGHWVEIFSGTPKQERTETYMDITVHRIKCMDSYTFGKNVLNKFAEINSIRRFDILESPEINGNGYEILSQYPQIPHIVKLHTPAVFIVRLLNTYQPLSKKLRFVLGSFLRGKIDLGYWSKHDKNQHSDIDYLTAVKSSIITVPSLAMKRWAHQFWRLPEHRIKVVPNPYIPDQVLLNLEIRKQGFTVTFLGRLNVLKGLVNLTKAIQMVLQKHDANFIIIGKDGPSHINGLTMKSYMKKKLTNQLSKIKFIDGIELDELPLYFGQSDIVVIPSLWENFPMVCLEAMLAGRSIVAGNIGGMPEMLDNGNCGKLVNPHQPSAIARAICEFLENPEESFKMARAARERVNQIYNPAIIGEKMESIYLSITNKSETL